MCGKEKINRQRWKSFVREQSALITITSIPESYFKSEKVWIDFLIHGYIDHHNDQEKYSVDHMSDSDYESFCQLVENYFEYGFSYFTPLAFRNQQEIEFLRKKYDE